MKIIIVDDDKFVCASLKTILEADDDISVVAVGYSGDEAIELYHAHKPDILLMDIRMSGKDGLLAGEQILKTYENAKILYLTTFSDNEYIIKALRIGAKGYLLKQDIESIAPSLKAVFSGQSVFGGEIITKLPSLLNNQDAKSALSHLGQREQEIIALVAKGLNNKEISEKLYLSEGTVRNYISIILDKLNLRDRTQLAVFYYR